MSYTLVLNTLRDQNNTYGIKLDKHAWANTKEVANALNLDVQDIEDYVAKQDAERLAFDDTHDRIRATYAHNFNVVPTEKEPPLLLYHGTADATLISILTTDGINKGTRNYVHLNDTVAEATRVGQRHGNPIILTVCAGAMLLAGHKFYQAPNGVWLTQHVPPEYISISK